MKINHYLKFCENVQYAQENKSNSYILLELKKINSRIRSYGTDFSSSKGYSVLLGLGPDMSVISGDSKNDVTEEFISYINKW